MSRYHSFTCFHFIMWYSPQKILNSPTDFSFKLEVCFVFWWSLYQQVWRLPFYYPFSGMCSMKIMCDWIVVSKDDDVGKGEENINWEIAWNSKFLKIAGFILIMEVGIDKWSGTISLWICWGVMNLILVDICIWTCNHSKSFLPQNCQTNKQAHSGDQVSSKSLIDDLGSIPIHLCEVFTSHA